MSPKTLRPEFLRVERLSPTEYEIFLLLGDGMSTREVSNKRHSSIKTIETHIQHMKEKLDAPHSRALQVLAAKFTAFHGKPTLTERVIERRLVFNGEPKIK